MSKIQILSIKYNNNEYQLSILGFNSNKKNDVILPVNTISEINIFLNVIEFFKEFLLPEDYERIQKYINMLLSEKDNYVSNAYRNKIANILNQSLSEFIFDSEYLSTIVPISKF